MYIDHIEIKNFRTFRQTRIDFCHAEQDYQALGLPRPAVPNVNLLLANNGLGKTTLLRAIALAALGPAASLSCINPSRLVRREQVGKPDADPFDLLCHLAFNKPVLTRRQRADRVKREEKEFFAQFGPEAREILGELLEKYAEDGELQFTLADVLKVAPVSRHGNVAEIVGKFGSAHSLRIAISSLNEMLYAS